MRNKNPEQDVRRSAVDGREDLDQVFSLAYEELKYLAASVRRSHPSAPLSPTTMVNEAWIKLARTPGVANTSPLHFRRIAARAMRQVLVSEARAATHRSASSRRLF
jgi:hypothetical protein